MVPSLLSSAAGGDDARDRCCVLGRLKGAQGEDSERVAKLSVSSTVTVPSQRSELSPCKLSAGDFILSTLPGRRLFRSSHIRHVIAYIHPLDFDDHSAVTNRISIALHNRGSAIGTEESWPRGETVDTLQGSFFFTTVSWNEKRLFDERKPQMRQ
ncbi:hypothetical protein Cob_v007849 [Colletotrichum orbiculare MAFF 240422]|uniref:Uncharacterized protein n=1 Tax=Colletotrichum orbiculare (strain 104-T / ATCC 96160 / CBS 514.97 / LARS 414 / MAFF 240422) TaxID=1213857 RepID=A0A484FNQ1_COLOR|nr:hypothetical protein Cob_v007849 [Colletotrichum orbiculare MAFF 240422]